MNVDGWLYPTATARKSHFFVDGRSLCGNYAYFGLQGDDLVVDANPGPDDCRACHAKALKRFTDPGVTEIVEGS